MIKIQEPYLLFVGDAENKIQAKTATGIAYFKPEKCVGYIKSAESPVVFDNLPELSLADAKAKGAKTLILGLANMGGYIPENWITTIIEAIELGYDIANGMHTKLESIPAIADAAKAQNIQLHNVRHYESPLKAGSGKKRKGKRILTIGTDCSTGKMYSSLVLEKAMLAAGFDASFAATGQTGILISGSGIAVDAVVSDFISGAVEEITPDAADDHYYIIEGQGSLFHPAYAGVSLGLLHGAQPDYLVICDEPKRPHMRHLPDYPVPDILDCLALNLHMAELTNPNVKPLGICLNTSHMEPEEAAQYKAGLITRSGLPVIDPCIDDASKLIESLCEN
jgi:uncharacterized NAD-dependent epimerase/dehydratase family protein